MLDVCLLGTGGMMPLPRRWLTALMTRYNGHCLLIDCGEGTQVAINPLSRRSHQRTSWSSSYNGECRAHRTAYLDWSERS